MVRARVRVRVRVRVLSGLALPPPRPPPCVFSLFILIVQYGTKGISWKQVGLKSMVHPLEIRLADENIFFLRSNESIGKTTMMHASSFHLTLEETDLYCA